MKLLDIARRAFGISSVSAANLWLLQEPSSSGERVTEETCWNIVPVYRAITMIANDIGRLPISVGVAGARGVEQVESAAADLLMLDASRHMGGFELRRTMTGQCLRYGNAFAQVVRSGRGEVLELVPLLPGDVNMQSRDGDLWYVHSELGRLEPDEVLHVRAPGSDGLWGESPVRRARESLGLHRAMEKTAGALYSNAGVPKLAFVHPGSLSAAAMQSIAQSYTEHHAGAKNAGRPLVIGEGMRIEKINQTLEDQMFAASREFSIQEVSRLFGVPVIYLAEHSRSTFASISELARAYWDGCLAHWCAVWADEIRRKLLLPGQRVVWDTRDLLKGSMLEQVQALRSAVESGLMTANEARERLGLNPLQGLDVPLQPENTRPASPQDEQPDA